jgi:hypothetical protein
METTFLLIKRSRITNTLGLGRTGERSASRSSRFYPVQRGRGSLESCDVRHGETLTCEVTLRGLGCEAALLDRGLLIRPRQ